MTVGAVPTRQLTHTHALSHAINAVEVLMLTVPNTYSITSGHRLSLVRGHIAKTTFNSTTHTLTHSHTYDTIARTT